MAVYGYAGLCMAMYDYILTNMEPLYDAFTTYLPKLQVRILSNKTSKGRKWPWQRALRTGGAGRETMRKK